MAEKKCRGKRRVKNPYVWNAINIALFYGKKRENLLNEMIDGLAIKSRRSFGIVGSRRIGKTTLLRRLEQHLKQNSSQWQNSGLFVIPLYIDGLTLSRSLTAEDVWTKILQQLALALPDQLPQISELVTFETFKQYLQPILSSFPATPRIIVLFDEIEPITVCEWSIEFFGHWRSLLSNTPELQNFFTAVFSGAREMAQLQQDVCSPLRNVLTWRTLQVLDFEDSCSLMQNPIDVRLNEDFLIYVYVETGGHPMLIQYVMQNICDNFCDPHISQQDLKDMMQQFEGDLAWQFEEWWNRYTSSTARRIYAMMPDDTTTLSRRQIVQECGFSEARAALDILQHVGLVVAEDDGMAFRYIGEMFRRWYRLNGQPEYMFEHDPDVYGCIQNYGQAIADRYLSAWRICQKDLPNYSGAVVEIRETVTLLLEALAPKVDVMSEPGFKFESGEKQPTRRQRVRYIVRKQYTGSIPAEIESDYMLWETLLSQLFVDAHKTASNLTHTMANRERAFEILKRWDAILKQLLPK